ncbi:MAG: c-type cytochrome [Pseudooceanicola sp.]
MRKFVFAAAALSVIGVTGAAIGASHADPAVLGAIKARQSVMQLYAFNLGKLGAMAKGEMDYDADIAKGAAENLAALASLDQSQMWPSGSDNSTLEETRALPALWEDMQGVMKTAGDLATATSALAETAGDGLDAVRAGLGPVGGACGACHKAYRASES